MSVMVSRIPKVIPVSLLVDKVVPCATVLSVAGLWALSVPFHCWVLIFPFNCWTLVIPVSLVGNPQGIQGLETLQNKPVSRREPSRKGRETRYRESLCTRNAGM